MPFNLGFIGGGNMSTAIFKGILSKEAHPVNNIWVSGPHVENLEHWKDLGANVTCQNGDVYYKCDIIFLGVKPGMLEAAVNDCLKTTVTAPVKKNTLFVSMLAGISIQNLHEVLHNTLSRTISVIRIMPNTPLMVGAGACLLTPDPTVSKEQCALVEKLLNSCGVVERVPESMMGSLGSLVGCGPAYMYLVIEALADGAVKQGAPRAQAQRLAAQMVMGSGLMVLKSGKHPGLLKDEVCSPGGSTIAGVAILEDNKIRSAFINAIEASTIKTSQLGKK
ncbi:pyrroline-5-carboxylate reductase 3-like [Pectinophora gossypiella]|uniref:pyrroline-5-carboxylate reductase 3-like n=1 Tax=Pectinophora gossypiella TaxID=13191 RepID=UPI00214E136F|nr:pyrroline-5-carboxylate reductase 3-like [Pectinophora gossypiella]